MQKQNDEIGTVISGPEGPSPSSLDFVVYSGVLHRGQFVELDYAEGTMVCLVNDVLKSNRYFERFESVKEFESAGRKIFEQFPAHEWEYLIAMTRPLGVFKQGLIKRATFPPSPGTKVRVASSSTLEKFLGFDLEKGLMLGEVEHHNLPVKLNLSRLFQKHLAILAMSGAGKCASPDTKILLEGYGQKTIGNLVDSVLEKNKREEGGVEFWEQDLGDKAYAISRGKILPAKILGYYRRKSPEHLVRIRTRTGKHIEVTPEHQVPVFTGKLEWKQAGAISAGDYLFLPRPEWVGSPAVMDFMGVASKLKNVVVAAGCAVQKQSKVSTRLVHKVDESFARLFAYLLAEGHNTLSSRMTFTNLNSKIQSDFTGICNEKLGLSAKKSKHGRELLIDSVVLARSLENFGFTDSSWTKFIPSEILQSGRQVLNAFIATFIDCDGYISPKKPEIEITVASRKLADGLDEILTKLGVITVRTIKNSKGKQYQRIFVRGAGELGKLSDMPLIIDYKMAALNKWANSKPNTNIDVVPNAHSHLKELLSLLRMPQPQAESTGINNYLYRRDNPSRENLRVLLDIFEKRAEEIEAALKSAEVFLRSVPQTTEQDALNSVREAYANGLDFNQIAAGSGVSSTTARRVVRGITSPKATVFPLAQNALKLQGGKSAEMDFASIDGNKALSEIKVLCESLGYSSEWLCGKAGFYKQFLYSHASLNRGVPGQGQVISLAQHLKGLAEESNGNLTQARARLSVLKHFCNLNAFFDAVKSVETIKSEFEYVYDLSVENSNFVANGIVIHNSYLVSVLFEELLNRKKEDGRLGIIVMDAHGEYRSFAEPAKEKKNSDFSSKSRFVKAGEIQIGVPKLSVGLLSTIIPGISPAQKRDLGKIIEKLRREMKEGLGPFDFNAVKAEISKDPEMKPNTKDALSGWIISLEQLGLFGKTDNPSLNDLVKPGQLTIIDLSDIIDMRKKQIIVAYYARKLFDERRLKKVPPFVMVLEESHQFAPEKVSKEGAISRGVIETIAREGRKFGAGICLISQRPINLSATALSQCNTHIILRVTNPYDLDHIGKTSEGLDKKSLDMITSLRTGEALIVGEAVNYPVFFKVRKKLSQDSLHETSLEKSAIDFEDTKEKASKEIDDLL